MAAVPQDRGGLLAKSMQVFKGLAPHARHHHRWLSLGAVAAIFVVAARLALPWPLRAVAQSWMGPAGTAGSGAAPAGPIALDPVLTMGVAFLALILLLGFSDYCARLYFARFAIGTVRDLRGSVLRSVARAGKGAHAKRPGDLISRLVGDTARIKTALQGFLVHVATNGLTLAGATVIVLSMNMELGLIFAAAVVATAIFSVVVAGKVFRKALKFRQQEGRLADEIQSMVASRESSRSGLKKLNRSSGHHEASLTQLQGVATWVTHGIFGLAMLVTLWIGGGAVASGELPAADMVVVMMYALTMRGPIVRLARQGSRTGKVLGPAYRLIQLQDKASAAEAKNRARKQRAQAERETPSPSNSVARSGGTKGGGMRVLFSGYAPVHFACFQPLYERLSAHPDVEVFVSGGLRIQTGVLVTKKDGKKKKKKLWEHDEKALYGAVGVPADRTLAVQEMREQHFDVVFGANTKLMLPQSYSTTIQIFHGISFRNKAIRLANMGCDHYFLIGPYMHRRFVEASLLEIDDERAVPIGFMKTDRLLNGEFDRAQLLGEFGLDGSRPILGYAPTGSRHNSLETMGEEVIARLAASGKYDLLIKPHDHPTNQEINWFERLARYEDAHCRVVRQPDVTRLLYLADVLISDASSVTNEYSLLDRPIVFLDTPELIAAAAEAEESAVDIDTWGRRGGIVAAGPEDAETAVEQSLQEPQQYSEIRRAMAKDFFYNPGTATDAAMSWLQEHVLDGTA
jgi:ABC-type multidrug transport system fused ATPase/permease subunit